MTETPRRKTSLCRYVHFVEEPAYKSGKKNRFAHNVALYVNVILDLLYSRNSVNKIALAKNVILK